MFGGFDVYNPLSRQLRHLGNYDVEVLYGSQTGNTRQVAHDLVRTIRSHLLINLPHAKCTALSLKDVNFESYGDPNSTKKLVFILISTYIDGESPDDAQIFHHDLRDAVHDFRYERNFLSKVSYAVIGFGNTDFEHYCTPAIAFDKYMHKLGAKRMTQILKITDSKELEPQLKPWTQNTLPNIIIQHALNLLNKETQTTPKSTILPPKTLPSSNKKKSLGVYYLSNVKAPTQDPETNKPLSKNQQRKLAMKLRQQRRRELESAGFTVVLYEGQSKKPIKPTDQADSDSDDTSSVQSFDSSEGEYDEENDRYIVLPKKNRPRRDSNDAGGDLEDLVSSSDARPPMLTSRHRRQLTKEGYKLIGSHSAVKLCRWTKHHLRGRGGCYKHSFYGITSYQCMEATPSLACANKCVFCWRHHKNPVGKSWRWKEDPPREIVKQGISLHVSMISELRGVPGVVPERLEQAKRVRHCALSLVGEPIMYPRINELIDELHKRQISTFIVTNAQFPEAIQALKPVTQLYVSIDAATPQDLKRVDRPLFADYWDRFIRSLESLREKRQRTTYRLTLINRYNFNKDYEQLIDYGKLIRIGFPDLVEVKSVTYCGSNNGGSDLTIQDVPWPDEVLNFCLGLLEANPDLGELYEVACEHRHSCSVLICKKSFKVDGRWRTWIDYDKFHQLVESGERFTPEDYWAETPGWAVYGAMERGFSPYDERHYRPGKKEKSLRMHAEASERFTMMGSVYTKGDERMGGNSDDDENDQPPVQPSTIWEVDEEEEEEV